MQGFIRSGVQQFCGFSVELLQAPVCRGLDVFFPQVCSQLMKRFGLNVVLPARQALLVAFLAKAFGQFALCFRCPEPRPVGQRGAELWVVVAQLGDILKKYVQIPQGAGGPGMSLQFSDMLL